MKIAFLPYSNAENRYINIIIDILKSINGVYVYPFNLKRFFLLSKDVWGSDIVWLNWYETVTGGMYALIRIGVLFFLKLSRKKIIYTLHNKKSHESKKVVFSNLLQTSLYFFSDIIVVHSKISKNEIPTKYYKKVTYIPHPNYIEEYGEIITGEQETTLKLLFLGQIKPYKNIELLISIMGKFRHNDVQLTVMGKPVSEEYKQRLNVMSKGTDINFIFGFIDDDDISTHLANCDLLIFPYNINSSLNSGSVILAFSYGKTVICPLIGTLNDMINKKFFSYTYENEKEHEKILVEKIEEAIKLKRNNNDIFNEWGKIMYEEVSVNNSKSRIRKLINTMINNNHIQSA